MRHHFTPLKSIASTTLSHNIHSNKVSTSSAERERELLLSTEGDSAYKMSIKLRPTH